KQYRNSIAKKKIIKEAMASMKFVCVAVVMSMVVLSAPMAEAAINCGQVASSLAPCLTYLKGGAGPSGPCCGGVKSVLAAAKTTPDRQAACNCLKSSAATIPGLNQGSVAALPGKCGVNIPYKISASTNCATIRF
ncbi:hypothetical protein EYC94_25880, partial [Enterobacter hormaechei]